MKTESHPALAAVNRVVHRPDETRKQTQPPANEHPQDGKAPQSGATAVPAPPPPPSTVHGPPPPPPPHHSYYHHSHYHHHHHPPPPHYYDRPPPASASYESHAPPKNQAHHNQGHRPNEDHQARSMSDHYYHALSHHAEFSGDPNKEYHFAKYQQQVCKNDKLACKYYRKAAQQGHVKAMFALSYAYQHGQGVYSDKSLASHWYQKAQAQYHKEQEKAKKSTVGKNAKSYEATSKKNGQGEAAASKRPMTSIDNTMREGLQSSKGAPHKEQHGKKDSKNNSYYYTPADDYSEEAEEIFQQAAKFKTFDLKKAAKLFRQAASLGNANAMLELADMYKHGKGGFISDNSLVCHWLQGAANQGSAEGQYRLGDILATENVEGISQDLVSAIRWFRVAAFKGHALARTRLETILQDLNDAKQDGDDRAQAILRVCHRQKLLKLPPKLSLEEEHSNEKKRETPSNKSNDTESGGFKDSGSVKEETEEGVSKKAKTIDLTDRSDDEAEKENASDGKMEIDTTDQIVPKASVSVEIPSPNSGATCLRCVPIDPVEAESLWFKQLERDTQPGLPDFTDLVNFPDYMKTPRTATTTHHCVMCGLECILNVSRNRESSARKMEGATADMPLIPSHNKNVCSNCDVTIWEVTATGAIVRWCKGCKNFRPLPVGEKQGTRCSSCRDKQKIRYMAEKESKKSVKMAAGPANATESISVDEEPALKNASKRPSRNFSKTLPMASRQPIGRNQSASLPKTKTIDSAASLDEALVLAFMGDRDAQFLVAKAYKNGAGCKKNLKSSVEYMVKAAKNGLPEAQVEVGHMYLLGEGVAQDLALAVNWLEKAAERKFAAAQYSLGVCHARGRGVKKNLASAASFFFLACKQGHSDAAQQLVATCRQLEEENQAEGEEILSILAYCKKEGLEDKFGNSEPEFPDSMIEDKENAETHPQELVEDDLGCDEDDLFVNDKQTSSENFEENTESELEAEPMTEHDKELHALSERFNTRAELDIEIKRQEKLMDEALATEDVETLERACEVEKTFPLLKILCQWPQFRSVDELEDEINLLRDKLALVSSFNERLDIAKEIKRLKGRCEKLSAAGNP